MRAAQASAFVGPVGGSGVTTPDFPGSSRRVARSVGVVRGVRGPCPVCATLCGVDCEQRKTGKAWTCSSKLSREFACIGKVGYG